MIEEGKKDNPDYPYLSWISGLNHLQLGQPDKAEADLQKLEKIYPHSSLYYHLAGSIALAGGDYTTALDQLQKPLQKIEFICYHFYEHREFYQQALADAYFKRGDYIKAVQECNKLISENPNWAQIYYLLAGFHQQKGDAQKALTTYRIFLDTWPQADTDLPQIMYAKQQISQLNK